MFNSMVNKNITTYMEKFGICGWEASNRYTYQESSPYTNLMLNVKYLITPYGAYLDTAHMDQISQSGNVKLLENKYYLPQGFMTKSTLSSYDIKNASSNPMENQNNLFRLTTGLEGNIYRYLPSSSSTAATAGASITDTKNGIFTYSSSQQNDSFDINYIADTDGTAVAYFSGGTDNISIRVNGAEKIGYYIKRPFIMMVGDVKKGDTITLHATMANSSSGSITSYCAMFNDDLFKQGYDLLSKSTLDATTVKDSYIAGDITAQEDGLFYTSISYTKGWKAYVDGKETEITPVGDAMLAFPLEKGEHHIELKYIPEGFIPGLICTLLALMIFIALIILAPKREQIFAKIKAKKTAPDENSKSDNKTAPSAQAQSDKSNHKEKT